jgi:ParB family chromosome partitioning protein
MTPTHTTTPKGTQARILRQVAAEKYPKFALGSIAANHHMTLAELQAIINRHGYPDPAAMRAAADRLEAEQTEEYSSDAATASEGPELGTLSEIALNQLHADPENVREHLGEIEELADSMHESGLLQPIIARRHGNHLIVVAGHRRLAAARHLRWSHIACIVRDEMTPDDVLAAMLIENGQRKDLDPIEEARALKRLKVQMGCTDLELARRVGKSQPTVSARLALLDLSPEDQEKVRRGEMSRIEGVSKGRLNSGKVGATGVDRNWHLGPNHPLANRAKARCKRLKHKAGRIIGGMACGECWESVLRADAAEHLQEAFASTGRCTTCGHTEAVSS